ncbi:unnamed protein product [Paramecium primaurelia]|uniref:Uncharacterized protein n=1 Tax=Paramecium primaurelia TaxID=5886 RepID=A0A8S1QKJ6_PARPR|nr:unnamed protein product [Paramecium primaurelia]
MLKIQRSKSCDAILIALKNLDKEDNQSQQSFRAYDNSTVLDLIVHIQKNQHTEKDIKLFFEQNIQFTGDLNQYVIDIIKRTKNRNIGYRIIDQQIQSKSEFIKINEYAQSEIYPEKKIMATQIPITEYYNADINNNHIQNQVSKFQLKNKENLCDQREERQQIIDNIEQFKQIQPKVSQQFQQFSQLVNNVEQKSEQVSNESSQSQNFKQLEMENQKLKEEYKKLQNMYQNLQEENKKLKDENQILKNIQNNVEVKQISPVSDRIVENRLSETSYFTNKCNHQIKEQQLESILAKALFSKQKAKCPQCSKDISNNLCQQILIFGRQYLDMKNQMDLLVLSENIQLKLKSHKDLQLVHCSNKRCNFICIWQQNQALQKQQGYCPVCLQHSISNPQYKSYNYSHLIANKGTK